MEVRLPRHDYPWLGVEIGESRGSGRGFAIARTLRGSPAARARLTKGDIIVSAHGEPLTSSATLAQIVKRSSIQEVLVLEIERGGIRAPVQVPLEPAPATEDVARLELIGHPAPEISGVITFQGSASSLRELLGKVVLLEFWASYCPGCRALAPRLERLHVEYAGRGLTVMGLTVDPLQYGAEVARKLNMSYSLASDPDASVTHQYLAREIPMLVLIDRRGHVRDVAVGPGVERMTEIELELQKLLAEPV